MGPWNLMNDLEKQEGASSILLQTLYIISKASVYSNWSCSLEMLNLGQNWQFFVLCDLEIWWITLENKRVTFLYHIKLYVSFQTHRWIQIGVTVRKHPIWVKICEFFVPCDFEFDGWAKKTTGHLFYTMLRFAHQNHGWIQTGVTVQKQLIWVKIGNFLSPWPWNLMDDLKNQWGISSIPH